MGAPRVTPKVAEYFLGHPNKPLSLTQICDACGFNKTQTQASIDRLLREEKLPGLVCLVQGSLWRYEPSEAPAAEQGSIQGAMAGDGEPTWYYEVGRAGNSPLVRCEGDPTLYVLRPLEV
jgi:hypothetical protein